MRVSAAKLAQFPGPRIEPGQSGLSPMPSAAQVGNVEELAAKPVGPQPFWTIQQLAARWHCSRASIYRIIHGEKVLDFAASGRKGHKLIPLDVVQKIERTHLKVLR